MEAWCQQMDQETKDKQLSEEGEVPASYNIQQQINSFQLNCYVICDLDHKTSHKGQFFDIEIYTPSES